MTSPDGAVWTAQSGDAGIWQGVVWAPELSLLVAVGGTGAVNQIMTSPTGVVWTPQVPAAGTALSSVAWSPQLGLLAAVGQSGSLNTSPNGTAWTSRTATVSGQWNAIAWSPLVGAFVAVAASGTGRVMMSTDGVTWRDLAVTADKAWTSITWSPSRGVFLAVSSNGVSGMALQSGALPALLGVNSWNGLAKAIAKGSKVHIFVQRDDLAAQAALGQLELDAAGNPTDGVREYMIVDERRGEESLAALCDADLALFSRPTVSVQFYTRSIMRSGQTVHIDLPGFSAYVGDYTIQSVDITFGPTPTAYPLRFVKASSVAFTLSDLFRRVTLVA